MNKAKPQDEPQEGEWKRGRDMGKRKGGEREKGKGQGKGNEGGGERGRERGKGEEKVKGKAKGAECTTDKEGTVREDPTCGKEGTVREDPICGKEGTVREGPTCGKEGTVREDPTCGQEGTVREDPICGKEGTVREGPTCGKEGTVREDPICGKEGTVREDPTCGKEGTVREDSTCGKEGTVREGSTCGKEGTVFEGPKCLIEGQDAGFRINKDTLQEIATVEKTLNVVTIVGLYRTGKSYLLTRLAGKYSGFALGNAIVSKTKGIWAWCVDHPVYEDQQLLLLDTEGLGDVRKGDQDHDNKIFTIVALLSSTLIYNAQGAFNQDALQKLSCVLELAKNIKSSEDEKDNNGGQLDVYLPDFILVLRDFTLNLESEDGTEITEDEYLEHCLELRQGEGNDTYNEPRARLRQYFKRRKCFTLVPPGRKKQLKLLDSLTDEDLDEDFVEGVHVFLTYMFNEAKPLKARNETGINGRMFATLAESYVDAIDKGGVPCIDSSMKAMAEKENAFVITKAFERYSHSMDAVELPTEHELELVNTHRSAKLIADEMYIQKIVMDEQLVYKEQLAQMIRNKYSTMKEENERLSKTYCYDKIAKLHDPIATKFRKGDYFVEGGFNAYQNDMDGVSKDYNATSDVGFMKHAVWIEFLKQTEQEKETILRKDTIIQEAEKKDKIAKEEKKIKEAEMKQLLEEKIRVEHEKKLLEADMKREHDKVIQKMKDDMMKEQERTAAALKMKDEEMKRLEKEGQEKRLQQEKRERDRMEEKQIERTQTQTKTWSNWAYDWTVGWLK